LYNFFKTIKLKPVEEGYCVSGQDVELILEIIEMNTNEEELKLLKYIYNVSLEHREKLLERLESYYEFTNIKNMVF
jgi:hypothetical protein